MIYADTGVGFASAPKPYLNPTPAVENLQEPGARSTHTPRFTIEHKLILFPIDAPLA